ncbi:hypothetical protein [Falsiroseomonas sp.]|uniref:hypothetical protein n=1 Tax=Falsiroseomonas sp. TaxID=2870721 RepID=UPI0035680E7D
MALLFFEGFDKYATATQMLQQANYASTTTPAIVTTTPRTGRGCLEFWNSQNARFNVVPSGNTLIVGAGVFFVAAPNGNQLPIQLWASNQARVNLTLGTNGSGQLQLRRDTATVLWTGTDVEPAGTWLHYELKAVLDHTTNGAITLRRNGQIVAALTGVQTKLAAADVVDAVRAIENGGSGLRFRLDDLYICDGSGTANNDFLGQRRVRTLLPNADLQAEWTATPVGSNAARVADAAADDDTGYVSAVAAGPVDRYGLEDLPASVATVSGVRLSYRVRKQDAVPAETRCFLQSSATVAQGPDDAPDVTYRYFSALFPTDPATGAAWTPSAVNALGVGIERIL